MSGFPGSPRLRKGALVTATLRIPFQYNPETLSRSLRANVAGSGGTTEPMRLKGPPQETVTLEIVLDAMDALERGDATAKSVGIHPHLAALEMLIHPLSAKMLANQVLTQLGVVEIIPSEAPLTLFYWGPKRVVPVRLHEFTITEEAFDADLNPIQARVSLSLQILTYDDLGLFSVGGALSMGQHVLKEALSLQMRALPLSLLPKPPGTR